ncbi:MAG: hypothetical protein EHM72_12225 [Calditrichaeota bacterium]|nr:MAG: hypothetical protein EHM72_12225 [Calditrichota bacterium]
MKFFFSQEKVYAAEGAILRTVSKDFEPIVGRRYMITPLLTAPRAWDAVEASLNWANAPAGFEIVMNGQQVDFVAPTDVSCNVTVTPFFNQNRLFFCFEPASENVDPFTSGTKRLLQMWFRLVQQDDTFVLELDIVEDPL